MKNSFTSSVFLITCITCNFFACDNNLEIDPYLSIGEQEILIAIDYQEPASILDPKIIIIDSASENLSLIQNALVEVDDWHKSITSFAFPKIAIKGHGFTISLFDNMTVFKDENDKEYSTKSSVLDQLQSLTRTNNEHKLDGFWGRGELIDDVWTFCSVIPIDHKYSYKKGFWEIWDEDFQKVGEGDFLVKTDTIEHNNCGETLVRYDEIDRRSWSSSHQGTESSDELFSKIETSD